MEFKYILAIVIFSLFLITFILFLVVFKINSRKKRALMQSIEKMYSDINLGKMEYDVAVYDEETERIIEAWNKAKENPDGQITIEDVMSTESAVAAVDESVFSKVDTEGIEEITGNYHKD